MLHHREVMADEQIGQLQLPLQIPQQIDHLRLNGYIEGGDGFIADDDLGFDHQRPCDADALTLASGKGVGVAHQVHGVQAHLLCHGLCPLVHFILGHLGEICF